MSRSRASAARTALGGDLIIWHISAFFLHCGRTDRRMAGPYFSAVIAVYVLDALIAQRRAQSLTRRVPLSLPVGRSRVPHDAQPWDNLLPDISALICRLDEQDAVIWVDKSRGAVMVRNPSSIGRLVIVAVTVAEIARHCVRNAWLVPVCRPSPSASIQQSSCHQLGAFPARSGGGEQAGRVGYAMARAFSARSSAYCAAKNRLG